MAIRYDEEGNPYDDGSYDYSEEAPQEYVAEEEYVVEEEYVPEEDSGGGYEEDYNYEQDMVEEEPVYVEDSAYQEEPLYEGNDIYVQEDPYVAAADPVVEEDPVFEEKPVVEEDPYAIVESSDFYKNSPAYEKEPIQEEPPPPVSGAEKVSTSQYENLRATPLRPGGATPVRDFLFGRKGRYTQSEPVVSSSPVAVVSEEPVPVRGLEALAPTEVGAYDYRPASIQGPPSELMRDPATRIADGVIKMPAGNPNPEVPTIFTNRLNDPERIMAYQYKMGMNDIPETTTYIDKFGREIPASGFFPVEDSAAPVTAKPAERIMVSDGVIKMPAGDPNPSPSKIAIQKDASGRDFTADPFEYVDHPQYGTSPKMTMKQFQEKENPPSGMIDKFGRDIPYKYSMLDRTPEGMAIIPKGNKFQGDSDPKYGRVFNPLVFPEMERTLIQDRDNKSWGGDYANLINNGSIKNLEQYYAGMERLGFKPNEMRTVYPEGQPLPPKQTDLPQFDPKWDGSLRVTNPDGTVQGAQPAAPKSVPVAAAAAGTMGEAPAAPVSKEPAAPAVSDPLAPVNSVEAKTKAALGAAKSDPNQLTPFEFEQKIHGDMRDAAFLKPEDQDKANDAYDKALAEGKVRPIEDPEFIKDYNNQRARAFKNLSAEDLTGKYYDTKDKNQKLAIADQILTRMLEPLTENQKEALRDGESVKRKLNYIEMPKGIGGLFQHTNSIAREALSRKPGGVFITTPQDVGLGKAPASAPAPAAPAPAAPAGAAPAGPSGQGSVTPRPEAKTTNSIMPVEGNKLVIPSVGINGELKTDLIKAPDQIPTIGEANQAVAKISARQAEDINNIPLPNIKKILRSQQGRQDALDEGTLNYLQNETNSWSESIKKEWSESQTTNKSGSNSAAQGRSNSFNNSFKNAGGGSSSNGTDLTNKTGSESSAGSSQTSQVGGSTGSTKSGDTTKVDNRANVMKMLDENGKAQVETMMANYANELSKVSRNHKAMLAPYLDRQKVLSGRAGDYRKDTENLFKVATIPENFAAAVDPTNASNLKGFLNHVNTRQAPVVDAWNKAVPYLYLATDNNGMRDTGKTPLANLSFPHVKNVIDGALGQAGTPLENLGLDTTDLVDRMRNNTGPEDLAREYLRTDGSYDGLATMKAGGSTGSSKSVQAYNSARILNGLDVLTTIATLPSTRNPDGTMGPKQLIPFDKFVLTASKMIHDNPANNNHLGPVTIEFMKSVPEYRAKLEELSKSKGYATFGYDTKQRDIYYKLNAMGDPANFFDWYNGRTSKLIPRK
jgi:hypothetical protein